MAWVGIIYKSDNECQLCLKHPSKCKVYTAMKNIFKNNL